MSDTNSAYLSDAAARAQWTDDRLCSARYVQVPEHARDRWFLLMVRAGLKSIATAIRHRAGATPNGAAFARAIEAAAVALVAE